ncbi:MAG: hypothetical protein AAFV78_21020 [Bacteroidota bacterium]
MASEINLLQQIIARIHHDPAPLTPPEIVQLKAHMPEASIQEMDHIMLELKTHRANQQKEVKAFNDMLRNSGTETFEVITELKNNLKDTLKESQNAQNIARLMFIFTFSLGLILIGVAVYFGIMGQEILSIAFGSFGMLEIVFFMLVDPPLKIQDSRSNYAQLSVGMLAWFTEFYNSNAMMVFAQNQGLKPEQVLEEYHKLSNMHIEQTVQMLRVIDEVAEPGKKRGKKKKKEENSES